MPLDAADIVLSPDQTAVALREIKNAFGALSTIAEALQKNLPLNAKLVHDILYVSEHYLADLGKVLKVETEGAAVIAKRTADIKVANMRIRELEAQLGNTQSPEATQMSIQNLAERLTKWWTQVGFGHVSSLHFGRYGCEVNFSCHLFGDYVLIDSKTPLTDKQKKVLWHKNLETEGYVLADTRGEISVADCDASRNTLRSFFAKYLPSARVTAFENYGDPEGVFVLRSVKVFIKNISEVPDLPILPELGD